MPTIRGESPERLLDLLREPENHVRHWARRHLQNGPEDAVLSALETWVDELDPEDPNYEHHLTEALWVYAGRDIMERALHTKLLGAKNPNARAAAARLIRHWLVTDDLDDDAAVKQLAKLLMDPSQRVRLEAIVATGFLKIPEAVELVAYGGNKELDDDMRIALRQTLKVVSKFGEPTSETAIRFSLRMLSKEEILKRPKDEMVTETILRRSDVSREEKESALKWLMDKRDLSRVRTIVDVMAFLNEDEVGAVDTLGPMLLDSDPEDIYRHLLQQVQIVSTAKSQDILHYALAGAMMAYQNLDAADRTGQPDKEIFAAILLISHKETLAGCYEKIREKMLQFQDDETRRNAFLALAHIPANRESTIKLLEENILDVKHRPERRFAAIEALNNIPESDWTAELRPYKLAAIEIEAVQNSLLFAPKEFSVKAGQPVVISFNNPDGLDHNIVLGKPGSLQDIGIAATQMVTLPNEEGFKRHFVPDHPSVIQGSRIIGHGESLRLSFFAPNEPGDYVYVCTYPGHFATMNGVMKVE